MANKNNTGGFNTILIQKHYEKGMILPISVAPWTIHISPVRIDNEDVKKLAFEIYNNLNDKGIDTLIDDRNISAGVKFADADLLGMPIRIVVSPKLIEKGEIEIKIRSTGEVLNVKRTELYDNIDRIIKQLNSRYL